MQKTLLAFALIFAAPVSGQQIDSPGFPVAGKLTIETLEAVHSTGTLYRFPRIGGDT